MNDEAEQKAKFLQSLAESRGIVLTACARSGVSRSTFYWWYANDEEFKSSCQEIREMQIDLVEDCLLKKIEAGDSYCMAFYLKTRGRNRGWSERVPLPEDKEREEAAKAQKALPRQGESPEVKRKIKNKKDYIIKLLKKEGKYTPELALQADLVARLWVRTEMLGEEIFDSGHSAVNVEISREGNERESASPKERLFLEYTEKTQRALRALGMNVDAKERKTDNDGFAEFMNEFKSEE